MYELYEKVIKAYKENNENTLTAAAINWVSASEENPFNQDTPEHDLFFNALKSYRIWRSGAINARISKKRLVRFVREIAALDLPNPYKANSPKEEKKIVVEEPVHVLGVIPEEEIEEEPEIKVEAEIATEEEQKSDKKHMFKRKKR